MDKFIALVYPQAATLFDYFPPEDSLLFFSEGNKLKERVRTTLWQWGEDVKSYLAEGLLCKGLDQYSQDWEYALGKRGGNRPPCSWTCSPGAAMKSPPRRW